MNISIMNHVIKSFARLFDYVSAAFLPKKNIRLIVKIYEKASIFISNLSNERQNYCHNVVLPEKAD